MFHGQVPDRITQMTDTNVRHNVRQVLKKKKKMIKIHNISGQIRPFRINESYLVRGVFKNSTLSLQQRSHHVFPKQKKNEICVLTWSHVTSINVSCHINTFSLSF